MFLCFQHIEHQNSYYKSKVRTFLECEDISAVVYDCQYLAFRMVLELSEDWG